MIEFSIYADGKPSLYKEVETLTEARRIAVSYANKYRNGAYIDIKKIEKDSPMDRPKIKMMGYVSTKEDTAIGTPVWVVRGKGRWSLNKNGTLGRKW